MMRFWQSGKRDDLGELLAACLDEIDTPEQIPACLARHPERAAELESLLQSAFSVRRAMAQPIREDRRLEARRQFLQAAANRSWKASQQAAGRQETPSILLRPLWSTLAPAAVAAALFVVALMPVMSLTSVSALPGDWNYGFKRSAERVRLALTLNPGDRLNLELAFHDRRLGEIERLAADGRLNDPALVQQFTDESSALVQAVSNNPQLGPSEALKVAEQTQAQTQALSDKVAPLASASLKPAVDDAVQQSQQMQQKASEVVQAKAESRSQSPTHGNNRTKSTLTPSDSATAAAGESDTTDDSATATATPAATATATGTPTAPAATGTAVALVPPALAPPTTLRTPTPPVLRPPSGQASAFQPPAAPPTVAPPLVPPSQPPASSQQIVARQLPPGQTTAFTYTGAEMPIAQALSSISGAYDAVFYTQPREHGGSVFEWYPGQSDPSIVLEPGSQVAIHIKPGAPANLSFATAPEFLPR
jgi:hypothetical protein